MSNYPRIEFGDIRIGETARKHINDCLDRNWITAGPKTEWAEKRFANLMGTKHAVATGSGTASLTAMTLALYELAKRPIRRGHSKVICPALAFIANSAAVPLGGLVPKWVDIRPETLNIDEDKVEAAIDKDVVAIYAVGTMGRPAAMDKLRDLAEKYDLILFEDACENYGSKYKGKFSHDYCIGGCSSFYLAHLIVAGQGSMIYTDDDKLADICRSIISHGRKPNSDYFLHERLGSNFRTTDLCMSVALEAIDQFYDNISERKIRWRRLVNYTQQWQDKAWFSSEDSSIEMVMPHGFSITLKPDSNLDIKKLQQTLDKYNIHWKRNFGFCGDHPALASYMMFQDKEQDFKWARWCGNNGLHIGTHRYMNEENMERIEKALKEFFACEL